MKKKRFTYLSANERSEIEILRKRGYSMRSIAFQPKNTLSGAPRLNVGGIFLDWSTLEKEILRYKMVCTSRTILEFSQKDLVW